MAMGGPDLDGVVLGGAEAGTIALWGESGFQPTTKRRSKSLTKSSTD